MRAPLAFAAMLFLGSCAAATPNGAHIVVAEPGVPPHLRRSGDYAPRIDSEALWTALAASPGRELAAHTDVVKVIIDLEDDWRVYFLQSQRWEIHYYFASRFLSRPGHRVADHLAFNLREYRRPDRRFILGSVVHYRDQDRWTFELLAGDLLDVPRTIRAYQRVRSLVYVGDRLRYRPVPSEQDAHRDEFARAGVPLLTTDELFSGVQYQPLNPGEAIGYLRFVHGDPSDAHVRRNDIVVLDEVPLDLSACGAVITDQLQTPLGHLNVLSSNRGTPNMALRGAFRNATLRALDGRLVRLHVSPQEWSITPATQQEADHAWESRRPREPLIPTLDLADVGLPDLRTLRVQNATTVGAKAAQLGDLADVTPPVPIPRGFALPFHAYHDHVVRNTLEPRITAMLADPGFTSDPARREAMLHELRDRIEQAPVDPALLTAIRARARELFPGTRVRFRSSTNAEDLAGFNGAGLYRSTIAPANATDEQLATAIRSVWSSLWAFQAFEEREYFRIDQSRVAMAILVQESIDDDVVDGVAITANPFNQGRPGIFINAQIAGAEGGAVTSARGDAVPEQIIYYTYELEREFERLSRSSRTQGAPVVRDGELDGLVRVLRSIDDRFDPGGADPSTAADVEFIFAGPTRRLVIVQARPYSVRWDEGRGWARPPE
jgi:hypothetical protein